MGQFLDECGARGPLELAVEDSAGTPVGHWILPQPFVILGSDVQSDVRLPGEDVSKRHVYLQILGGRIFGFDLESRAGVKWGGIRTTSWWPRTGEPIEIGSYVVKVIRGGHSEPVAEEGGSEGGCDLENPLRDVVATEEEGTVPWLEVPGTDMRKPLVRRLTLIGRSPDCRLRIQDDRLSRHHCALLRTPGGVWIVDLNSREGIRLGGVRVRWGKIDEGDEVRIARYRVALARRPLSKNRSLRLFARPPEGRLDRTRDLRRAERARSDTPVPLDPMLQQFGELQQQMVDRFSDMQAQAFDQMHQMMLTMFQMFGSLHRDQMKVVREELKKVRELTVELERLESAKREKPTSMGSGRFALEGLERRVSPEECGPSSQGVRQRDPAGSEAAREGKSKWTASAKRAMSPAEAARVESHDIHSLLCERIDKLQQERSSRWQRILVMMTGSAV
jgi:hypothetical protein